jgi:hypothetical protein
MMIGPCTEVLLTDGSWAPLAWLLSCERPDLQVRVFTSRRRAQALRHDFPTWQQLGIGILPL